MNVTDRFLHYISFDTTSDSSSGTHPSTASQLDFAAMLADEMKQMGLTDISCDEYGYVFGTIPSTILITREPFSVLLLIWIPWMRLQGLISSLPSSAITMAMILY